MTETLEAVAKAPTAYEEAKYIWGDTPGNDALGKQEALYEMVVALAQEIADEREIVRGQAEVIQRLRDKVGRHGGILIGMAANWSDRRVDVSTSHPEERAGHLDGLDAADFWTIHPDEPEEFAGNYPAAGETDR